ncbi:protein FATTY ACID EXPORT 1, chloroplastic [Sesamum angolense]|uniref:Protein FATTY ACID EXPORT 1, chloroplastic n=1 Tax=Sesamum angolense TaxID=2727404 RepID=A0AAE1WFI1_9LAMI|nr:protein FATTY ACID EXPORT 1, chloroplastic [Sesamum angolense]
MSSATAGGSSTPAPPIQPGKGENEIAGILKIASFLSNFLVLKLKIDGHGTKLSDLENKTTPSYLDDASTTGSSVTPNPVLEGFVVGEPTNGHVKEEVVSQTKRAAKIHDFCLGIPFVGWLVGFIFSRSPVTLTTGLLFGGALLALSTLTLKTKKLFPTGFNIVISAAMFCFYAHVVISRGNPPPKKFKTSTPVASS